MADKENPKSGLGEEPTTPDLLCPLTVENIDASGSVLRTASYKRVNITLVRNEFRDVVLAISSALPSQPVNLRYDIKKLDVHKRFAHEGRATLALTDHSVRLLLSNCAPNQLQLFLKTLSLKLRATSAGASAGASAGSRLRSHLRPGLTDISPLTDVDLNVSRIVPTTPGAGTKKESVTPVGVKRKWEGRLQSDVPRKQTSTSPRTQLRSLLNCDLTVEQQTVLKAVSGGQNVFFTGSAGTGKSFLLRKIVKTLPPDVTHVTASTGVAATHIGGTTLHAFAGVGSGDAPYEQCLAKASRRQVAAQWRKCRHLIIDEISMVSGTFFAKLEKIARVLRKSEKPFGGIQLILCGDFLQLPPVVRDGGKRIFAFQTSAWLRCMETTIELTQVHRQKDNKFISILREIRLGRCPPTVAEVLTSTSKNRVERNGVLATHLCTHNGEVDSINVEQLNKLSGAESYFKATDSNEHLASWLDQQCPVESTVKLKLGTQVMLLKNLDVQRGLVNGARGVVVAFDAAQKGYPVVHFACGTKITIKYERWIVRNGIGEQVVRQQLPLKLAWAISIHKSQGMTLDCVEMSLARIFECGQAYVALSRAKSLQGLRVLDFNQTCVRANSDVLKYYHSVGSVRNRLKNEFTFEKF